LKLINSRKIGFAGTLVSLLLCDSAQPATVDTLYEQFTRTPLLRLGQLALRDDFDELDDLRKVFLCAERFLSFLSDPNKREQVKNATSPQEAEQLDEFIAMKSLARELATALDAIFFGSLLEQRSRRYLLF
jgi:hypothetical protein